jgi:hypothetical protein
MNLDRLIPATLGLAAAAACAAPAQAVTFADYGAVGSVPNISFVGAPAGGVLSGSAETQFSFLTLDPSYSNLSAAYTLSAVSTVAPTTANSYDFQSGLNGSFSFIYDGPTTSTLTTGENLLSGTFTGAQISGPANGSTASVQDAIIGGGDVAFTSEVLPFSSTGDKSLSLELTSVLPGLIIGRAGGLEGFTGVSTGSFAADLSTGGGAGGVPEPATWALMLIGFAGVGFARRSSMAAQRRALA